MDAYYPLPVDLDTSIFTLSVLTALASHQVFRRCETYSMLIHALLLVGPPTVLAIYAATDSGSLSPAIIAATLSSAFTTYWSALALSLLAYRLSPFHPLARYPGPTLNKLSKLRMAFLSLSGRQNVYIKSLHDRYGDVVRIGPNELSLRDPSWINPLLGTSGLPKGPHFFGRLLSADTLVGWLVILFIAREGRALCVALAVVADTLALGALQDPELHAHRRRPWSRGFSPSALEEYEQMVTVRARQLVSRLEEQQGPVALDEWINAFSYDFMYDMAFGGGSEMLNGEKNNFWELVRDVFRFATFLGHVPWLGIYLGNIPTFSASVRVFLDFCGEQVQRRIERGSVKKDVFHYLSNEDIPEKEPPPKKQLIDDGLSAVVGGSDTVSSALSSLFTCLMDQPRVYDRLQEEIDRYYPPGEDAFDSRHHRNMHFLSAVVNETLRLFPPIPGCTQRQQPHRSIGSMVCNMYIPPGTSVWLHAYSMHRDPRNFSPGPDTFWPDRWLIASGIHPPSDVSSCPDAKQGSATFAHNDTAFIPFSYGPANCVGKNLAMHEMRAVVCALMQRFHIRPAEGFDLREYEKGFRDYFVTTRGRVPVVLEVRGDGGSA